MLLFDFYPFSPNTLLRGKNNKKNVIKGKKSAGKRDSAAARRNGKKTPAHFCTGVGMIEG